MAENNLAEIVFSDLFVHENPENSWYKPTPDSLITKPVPAACHDELTKLRGKLEEHKGGSRFKVFWPDQKTGFRMRVQRMVEAGGEVIYVCRRFRLQPGPLVDLGMPVEVADKLLSEDITNGLIIFLGKTGSGKSTTMGSFVIERLERYGGVCWTVERPVELPLSGRHGKGICYQVEADTDAEMSEAINNLYRATPNIIMIGEVRNAYEIREALVLATSGLVGVTFHANDLVTGLSRLVKKAADPDANEMLAEALRMAIHLELYNAEGQALPANAMTARNPRGTGTPPRILSVTPLLVRDDDNSIKSKLRNGEFHMLGSDVERQRRQFMMQKLP